MMPADVSANKTFVTGLKIVLEKMKIRDKHNHKACLKQLQNLLNRKKIPIQFMSWTLSVLGRNPTAISPASSVSSLVSEASANATASPQRETGAIRKT
jgi:hypothetical protein